MITSKQLNRLRDEAYTTACNKGFHDEKHSDEHYLMLVITEIAEAVQADRKGRRVTRKVREDYEQFMQAYNDISIDFDRLTYKSKPFTDIMFDLCSMITGYDPNLEIIVRCVIYYCNVHGIDILWHIERKMEYNRMRPRMHNAKY